MREMRRGETFCTKTAQPFARKCLANLQGDNLYACRCPVICAFLFIFRLTARTKAA